jgi:hypothetical protein
MPAINPMNDIRISLPTLILLLAVVGGGAFAAGSALPTASAPPTAATEVALEQPPQEVNEPEQDLPPGHPPIDDRTPQPIGAMGSMDDTPPAEEASLEWKAPTRWQLVPNTSTMRLATYRIPRAPGDASDAELSIIRAGGSAEANAERWVGQFDEAGQKTARRTTRGVGLAEVAIVEVRGTYSGGMGTGGSSQPGWALIGAIVLTAGTPYFFKLTGPEKSVHAARSEFDALIGSLVRRRDRGT